MAKTFIFLNNTPSVGGPLNKREVYWTQYCLEGYHDPSLRETFGSRRQMRSFLEHHKMRDTGERHNPDKALGGTEGCMTRRKT